MLFKQWPLYMLAFCVCAWATPGWACTGYSQDGYCYVLGQPGESCTSACKPYGGCAEDATKAIALNHTAENKTCDNTLARLFALQQSQQSFEFVNPRGIVGGGLGCFAFFTGSAYYGVRNVIPVTCDRGYQTARRACACNE